MSVFPLVSRFKKARFISDAVRRRRRLRDEMRIHRQRERNCCQSRCFRLCQRVSSDLPHSPTDRGTLCLWTPLDDTQRLSLCLSTLSLSLSLTILILNITGKNRKTHLSRAPVWENGYQMISWWSVGQIITSFIIKKATRERKTSPSSRETSTKVYKRSKPQNI